MTCHFDLGTMPKNVMPEYLEQILAGTKIFRERVVQAHTTRKNGARHNAYVEHTGIGMVRGKVGA